MKLEIFGINVLLFLLILARWAGFVMLAPVLGGRSVPAYVKIGLSAAITVLVFPLVGKGHVPPVNPVEYSMVLVQETLIGLSIGFITQKLIFILQGAGQIIDIQMGFSMGNLIDPINSTQAPLTGSFKVMLALMLLLATNAHHYLIGAMAKSYDYIPFLGSAPSPKLLDFSLNFLAGTFGGAVQIALPVVGVLVLAEIAMGFAAKALPQMNIFVVGFPVKIAVGLFLLLWVLPALGYQVDSIFQDTLKQLHLFYQGWGKQ